MITTNTIAFCKGVQLIILNGEWHLAELVEDNHKLHKMEQHEAHLIFNDYVGQVVASVDNESVKPKLNLGLKHNPK